MRRRCTGAVVALSWVGMALAAMTRGGLAWGAIPIEFMLTPPSGVAFESLGVSGDTSGSLKGNWDPETNPTGTRTKPGIFGTFGATENVPVPASVDLLAGGSPQVALGGELGLVLSPSAGTAEVRGFAATGVGGSGLTLSARVVFDAFRTRSPTSTFPGGIPVTLPLGSGQLQALSLTQVGLGDGVVTDDGGGRYTVAVPVLVAVSGVVEALGNVLTFGPVVVPVSLVGEVVLDGDGGATLSGGAGLSVEQTQAVEIELPALPFALPTVLPPGEVANVVFTLTLEQIAASLVGELNLTATGVVVPEPGGLVVLGFGALALCRRGRRRA